LKPLAHVVGPHNLQAGDLHVQIHPLLNARVARAQRLDFGER
jgi:hypothetical protein